MLKESSRQIIKNSLAGGLKQPVRLILFTSDVGCDSCPPAADLAAVIRAASPKIAFERYDLTMDRDKREEYGVQRAPSLVVEGPDRRSVIFSGTIDSIVLVMLLDVIAGLAGKRPWLPEQVVTTLGRLEKEVSVRVILDNACTLCRPAAETAVALAFANRKVKAEIVVADDFPDLLSKHRVKVLPYTLFGDKLHLEGHATESSFLEMIFKAEGVLSEQRCIVCGAAASEIICANCKTRIQSEAVEHKRKDEKLNERGMPVDRGHDHA